MSEENLFNEGKMYFFHPDDNSTIHESSGINTLLKLDKILERLHSDHPPGKSNKELTEWVNRIYKLNLDETNTSLALQKLMKEGYVTEWTREINEVYDIGKTRKKMHTDYYITFDGVILHNTGGYTQKVKDGQDKINRDRVLYQRLANGTVFLAIATICLLIFEGLKFLFDYVF